MVGIMAGNPFMINALGGFNPAERMNEYQAKNKLEAERKELMNVFSNAVKGTPEAMDELSRVNPELFLKMEKRNSDRVKLEGEGRAIAKKESELDWAKKYKIALANDDQETITSLISEAESNDLIDFDQSMIGKDKNQDNLVINSMLYQGLGKDGYKALVSGVGVKSRELPAEAVAFNDLIKDFTHEQKKTSRLVKAGLKGRAMSNAELSAIESGEIKNYADWKSRMKEQQKFAEMTGSSRAKRIDKGFETITKIDAGVRNIDRAITAIEGGAGVGVVEKMWPSIKAASVELDNIRSSMALDVVGATTFGALSAGELALAKDVALPTGLDSSELLVFLNDRKAAQQKLRDYYNEQIQFLDQGGTVAGFLRSKEQGPTSQPQPTTTQQPQQDQLSDQDLLSKYGG